MCIRGEYIMGNNRIEFTKKTKQLLCDSVSGHCSICGKCTTWVDESPLKKENIGEAAHIEAASEGGPRYNPAQSDEQRASFYNGIWVCSNCHAEIDSNVVKFDVAYLQYLKHRAMQLAKRNIDLSLKGDNQVELPHFKYAMISFFSNLYGLHESLHKFLKEIKKYVDNFFREYSSENMFITEYCFGIPKLINNLSVIREQLWETILPPISENVIKGRLYISDIFKKLEERYFKIIGDCPKQDIDWWAFFKRIKEKYSELEDINNKLLDEYKQQFEEFKKGI